MAPQKMPKKEAPSRGFSFLEERKQLFLLFIRGLIKFVRRHLPVSKPHQLFAKEFQPLVLLFSSSKTLLTAENQLYCIEINPT
jgi:hypothetical protein